MSWVENKSRWQESTKTAKIFDRKSVLHETEVKRKAKNRNKSASEEAQVKIEKKIADNLCSETHKKVGRRSNNKTKAYANHERLWEVEKNIGGDSIKTLALISRWICWNSSLNFRNGLAERILSTEACESVRSKV